MTRILIALLVLSGSVDCGWSAVLKLTRRGQTDYEIRIRSQADATESYAVRELGTHLQKITGAEFKVRRENTVARNCIVIVRPESRLPQVAITKTPLGEEEFHIRADKNGIVIRGGTGRGLLYGVYELLEGLGCRWFTSEISSIPRRATITVSHQNVRKKPAFEHRQFNSIDVRDSTWLVRNRINGGTHGIPREQGGSRGYAGRGSHTLYNLLPPAEYFQDHPEYFSLWHGKRTATMAQICMTHPDVRRIVAQNVGRLMQENPDATYVSVSQMDWGGGCQCARCVAVDSEESQGLDHRVWSGGFVRFANAVAEKTATRFPEKLIVTLAYGWTEAPPAKARPGKNVRILFCPIEACQVHDPQQCSDRATGKSLAHLRKWSELAAGRLYVWDYGIRFRHYLAPFPNLETLGDKWRLYQSLGVRGVYCQTGDTRSKGAESAWLRSYVQAKLLWDPKRDVKPIIEEFVRAVYGPAAEPVLAYYEQLHRLVRHPDHHMGTTGNHGSYKFIDKPWLDRCQAHLRDAEEKADGRSDLLEAIERLGLGVRYLRFWSENTFVVPRERGAGILNPDASREALDHVSGFLDDLGKLRIERLGESLRAEELSRQISNRKKIMKKTSHLKTTGKTAANEHTEPMQGLAERDPRFGKKLIAIGWDTPNPKYLKENLESFERSGYDGVVISARHNPNNRNGVQTDPRLKHALDNEIFLPAKLRYEDFRVAVDDLRSTPFQNLSDNFISITHINATTDFFDTEAFDVLAHNAGVAAAVARESGTKGFWFDVEDYFKIGFFCYALTHETHKDYKPAIRTAGKTFREYQDAARDAGRRWMAAVCNEYPDVTIIMVWAHHQAAGRYRAGVNLETDLYGLLPSFVDGMIEAGEQATIVDGYEGAYGFLRRAEFLEAYHDIRHYGRRLSKVPNLYDARLQAGFGLWLDMLKKWSTTDLESNHFSPQRFASSLRHALDVSDQYVWVWSETPFRWGDEPHQQAYRQAVLDARRPQSWARIPLPPSEERNSDFRNALECIGFLETHELLMTLPRQWQFRLDPDDVGLKREWYLESTDSREWQSIEIGKHWEDQGHDYDGYAWYRLCLEVPSDATKGKILLALGAVDESAWIYLNGQEICVHDLGIEGWSLAFTCDVSGRLDPGKNDLVIRVLDRIAAGGIWKDILLVRET